MHSFTQTTGGLGTPLQLHVTSICWCLNCNMAPMPAHVNCAQRQQFCVWHAPRPAHADWCATLHSETNEKQRSLSSVRCRTPQRILMTSLTCWNSIRAHPLFRPWLLSAHSIPLTISVTLTLGDLSPSDSYENYRRLPAVLIGIRGNISHFSALHNSRPRRKILLCRMSWMNSRNEEIVNGVNNERATAKHEAIFQKPNIQVGRSLSAHP